MNFPTTPTQGDIYMSAANRWVYTGTVWAGQFTPNTKYAQGAVIIVGGAPVKATVAFTSGLVFNPANWQAA